MIDPDDVLQLIKRRRSVRRYAEKPVPEEVMEQVLEAGRWAPSGANIQPRRFLVVTRKDLLERIARLSHYGPVKSAHVANAAALVLMLGDNKTISPTVTLDCAIAGTNMTLMAEALGIGSCWIGAFEEDNIRDLLAVPDRYDIVVMIAFGYPEGELPKPTPRLELENIVHHESFSKESEPSFVTKTKKAGPFSVLPKILGQLFGRPK